MLRKTIGRWLWRNSKNADLEHFGQIECEHDYTHWTDPVETTAKLHSSPLTNWTIERHPIEDAAQLQERRCLKCNIHERRYC